MWVLHGENRYGCLHPYSLWLERQFMWFHIKWIYRITSCCCYIPIDTALTITVLMMRNVQHIFIHSYSISTKGILPSLCYGPQNKFYDREIRRTRLRHTALRVPLEHVLISNREGQCTTSRVPLTECSLLQQILCVHGRRITLISRCKRYILSVFSVCVF